MIYVDFEIILVPENDEKQNPDEPYTNKHQNHVVCRYDDTLVCVDDSKPCTSYFDEGAVYNFINSMINKGCYDMMKKHFNKELVVTKINDQDFHQNITKCWICDNNYVDGNFKVRDHCPIIRKYRGSHIVRL